MFKRYINPSHLWAWVSPSSVESRPSLVRPPLPPTAGCCFYPPSTWKLTPSSTGLPSTWRRGCTRKPRSPTCPRPSLQECSPLLQSSYPSSSISTSRNTTSSRFISGGKSARTKFGKIRGCLNFYKLRMLSVKVTSGY